MSCKIGDLAYVKSTVRTPENVGRIVEVVRHAVSGEIFVSECGHKIQLMEPGALVWVVRSAGPLYWRLEDGRVFRMEVVAVVDKNLRPIRDNDGDDETIIWAGRPEQVAA